MGRDVVALRQHPGDNTALWGDESLSEGPPSLLLLLLLLQPGARAGRALRPGACAPYPPTPSLGGVINHLAPDSGSVQRSHLGWSRWLLHQKTFTNESFFISCVTIYPLTHALKALACRKLRAQQRCEVSCSVIIAVCQYTAVLHCPEKKAITAAAAQPLVSLTAVREHRRTNGT